MPVVRSILCVVCLMATMKQCGSTRFQVCLIMTTETCFLVLIWAQSVPVVTAKPISHLECTKSSVSECLPPLGCSSMTSVTVHRRISMFVSLQYLQMALVISSTIFRTCFSKPDNLSTQSLLFPDFLCHEKSDFHTLMIFILP